MCRVAMGFRSRPPPRSVSSTKGKSDQEGCELIQAARILISAFRMASSVSTATPAPWAISSVKVWRSVADLGSQPAFTQEFRRDLRIAPLRGKNNRAFGNRIEQGVHASYSSTFGAFAPMY